MATTASMTEMHQTPLQHLYQLEDSEITQAPTLPVEVMDESDNHTPPTVLHRDALGLPPTPPTLTNSDISAPRKESLASNQEFADAVRNALRAQASGTITPTGTHQTPQTPDPSPPKQRITMPTVTPRDTPGQDRERPKWPLEPHPGSLADSFHTARENVDSSQASMSRNLSPLSVQTPGTDWLRRTGSTALSQPDSVGLSTAEADGLSEVASDGRAATPRSHYSRPGFLALDCLGVSDDDLEAQLRRLKLVSDSPLIRRSLAKPAPAPSRIEPPTLRKSVVVTTISHDDENTQTSLESIIIHTTEPIATVDMTPALDDEVVDNADALTAVEDLISPVSPIVDISADSPSPKSTQDVSPVEEVVQQVRAQDEEPARVSEPVADDPEAADANNLVYREIREENVKRLSAIHEGGALRVGIILPKPGPERFLKRTTKCDALRGVAEDAASNRRHSTNSINQLRHKKAIQVHSLESSPVISSPTALQKPEAPVSSKHGRRSVSAPISTAAKQREPSIEKTRRDNTIESPAAPVRSPRASQLRGVSSEVHASKDSHNRKSSSGSKTVKEASPTSLRSEPALRRFSRESQLENNTHVRRTSLTSPTSDVSARKSLDSRLLQPPATPLSISQFSDRTDVEFCEAHGVSIFPHHNESVLVLNYGPTLGSHENVAGRPDDLHFPVPLPPRGVAVRVRPASPVRVARLGEDEETHSPLTNPRAAPTPPAFRVIPPTPSELDRRLGHETSAARSSTRPQMPQRSLSLSQRARRYSESHILPLFSRNPSFRRGPRSTLAGGNPSRPSHLSPFWRPRYFWEEYDSSDEEYEADGADDTLPPGGDTSETRETKKFIPRNMSVRMPGFRGTGGFLMGNSLGLDRHGTNNRRHYVPRKESGEILVQRRHRRRGSFLVPLLAHHHINPLRIRRQLSKFKASRAEKALERRRDVLRGQIQHTRPLR